MTDLARELAALRREVERLKARDVIRQQLARYGRGQEWLDESLLNELFWEDADIDFGFFKGVWRDYRPVLMEIERNAEGTFHMLASAQIEFEGEETAHVECYGIAGGSRPDGAQIFGGRYFHRFERRGGIWKSARCYYALDWTLKGVGDTGVSTSLSGINRVTDRSAAHPWFRRMGQDVTA